jgi:hypothetical protein
MALPDGTPVPGAPQVAGDCRIDLCLGGLSTTVNDDTDAPTPTVPCLQTLCKDGEPVLYSQPAGAPCPAGVCDGTGKCVSCLSAADCPGPVTECQRPGCVAYGCVTYIEAIGKSISQQIAGDCQRAVCDGIGGITTVFDANDVLPDNNLCTTDVCVAGTPPTTVYPAVPDGTPCFGTKVCLQGVCAP